MRPVPHGAAGARPDPAAPWSGTAVVAEHGRVVHEESSGSADGPGSTPCGPHLRFQASSLSKQVLSVVALALQQRDRLRLDRPITRWLPHLPPAFDDVTLHHLLSHTSGTGHWADLPGPAPGGRPAHPADPPAPDALRALVAGAGLLTPAGTAWRYSGPGSFLAADVLEAAGGRRYRDLAAEFVLGPAGMTSTTSGRFPAGWTDAAAGHRAGRRVHVDAGWTRITGSGDLWTTAGDLLRYSRALRTGRLLDPAAAASLWTPHAPLPAPPAPGPGPTTATAYGYGTFLGHVLGRPAWFVPGDNPGYRSLLVHPLGSDTDVVVLSNDEVPGIDGALGRALRP
ncbi:serine hydrolase domain-containing protein [Kineococcus sp. SYSU DK005]|uniref:serine hydrolase domain-containing protein n=1 Tax=Kineococcus sp. SYSU DK005 TaxID=3383126 RepID=UPI003D7C8309